MFIFQTFVILSEDMSNYLSYGNKAVTNIFNTTLTNNN